MLIITRGDTEVSEKERKRKKKKNLHSGMSLLFCYFAILLSVQDACLWDEHFCLGGKPEASAGIWHPSAALRVYQRRKNCFALGALCGFCHGGGLRWLQIELWAVSGRACDRPGEMIGM